MVCPLSGSTKHTHLEIKSGPEQEQWDKGGCKNNFQSLAVPPMNFFLSDPLRPAGDVWGVDGVDAARPSVLYASTGA